MRITRRDFLKAAAAATVAGELAPEAFAALQKVLRGEGAPRVIWLQGAGCDGCAISFLNSVFYATADSVLKNTIDLDFQNNLMAAAGDLAVSALNASAAQPGYILVVEGAIPTGAGGLYCRMWPGTTMASALSTYSPNAAFIVALGSCASYGGVSAGAPNPTAAQGVSSILVNDPRVVNVPGCPAHPDWFIGTITYLLTNGRVPPLDASRRPLQYFSRRIHDNCLNRRKYCGNPVFANQLSQEGCMEYLGCKGKHTYSDCPMRKWNSSGAGKYGVNWCIGARSPCLGCVNSNYPDGMSPFYDYLPAPARADVVEESPESDDDGPATPKPDNAAPAKPLHGE
ncbi:MAG TPA: hydrogenase small subunit [Phycisphaerae bacterium]|nr:hydrogenase small subunit [Phycisphaerae bacterium]